MAEKALTAAMRSRWTEVGRSIVSFTGPSSAIAPSFSLAMLSGRLTTC